ncbi:LuxR family transcriptional regulator [Micromonospora zingiberis]|uniref:LuxR family transcriptional regulator n=1 Tax=Micromonospora zingiberis TaxID=2053011 RepID=A0A4R0GNF6_9ACTN|nr:LuxR family transcriptional regulator [Micromonospora zingiberis]TCB98437.1 LuxR family transcriptional regulator [Micromonospora zingiberis]
MEIDRHAHGPEDADRLLAAADRAGDPVTAARLVAEAFVAVSRTADAATLPPMVRRLAMLRARSAFPQVERERRHREVEFVYHAIACAVGARTGRRLARPEPTHQRLADPDEALRLFTAAGLHDDPLYVECAMIAMLSAQRPDQVRPNFAHLVEPWLADGIVDPARRARLTTMLGMGDAWSGDLLRGRATLRRAYGYAVAAGRLDLQAEIVSWLAKCEALCGDLAESRRRLTEARVLAARSGSAWVGFHIAECAAALHLASGDIDAWVGVIGRLVGSAVGANSGLVFEHRWELATYHALRGDAGAARSVIESIADPPLDWPGAPALPAWRAWIADPDDPAAMAWLERALSGLNRPVERLSRARLAWLLGARHAHAGRRADAIRLLELASSEYAATGAAGLLARVAVDLHAIAEPFAAASGPPKRAGDVPDPAGADPAPVTSSGPTGSSGPAGVALTATERRVAAAVAEGLSNQEVAGRLSVSAKTIEFHLGNIYRKLGVRNRTELVRHLLR